MTPSLRSLISRLWAQRIGREETCRRRTIETGNCKGDLSYLKPVADQLLCPLVHAHLCLGHQAAAHKVLQAGEPPGYLAEEGGDREVEQERERKR